jgi:hypothetical protein
VHICERSATSIWQGVPYPSLPKKEKPRRVELYFSSWRIRAGKPFSQ